MRLPAVVTVDLRIIGKKAVRNEALAGPDAEWEETAALRLAQGDHGGEEEGDQRRHADRAGRRRPAGHDGERLPGAAGAQGRGQGRLGRRAGGEAPQRSEGDSDGRRRRLLRIGRKADPLGLAAGADRRRRAGQAARGRGGRRGDRRGRRGRRGRRRQVRAARPGLRRAGARRAAGRDVGAPARRRGQAHRRGRAAGHRDVDRQGPAAARLGAARRRDGLGHHGRAVDEPLPPARLRGQRHRGGDRRRAGDRGQRPPDRVPASDRRDRRRGGDGLGRQRRRAGRRAGGPARHAERAARSRATPRWSSPAAVACARARTSRCSRS